MTDPADISVTQGFYLQRSPRNFVVLKPVVLRVEQRRLRIVDAKDRLLLDAAAPEVSARFTRLGLMHLSHDGRTHVLNRQGANWSPSFTSRQVAELKAAGMPVPGLAGGMSGGGGDELLNALAGLGALADAADGAAALASGGSLKRSWVPILTALGCRVQTP